MSRSFVNQMMFCSNSSNQMNDGLVRLNGWSQVVPICMPWAANGPNTTATGHQTNSTAVVNDCNQNVMQFTANNIPMNASVMSGMGTVSPDPTLCPVPLTPLGLRASETEIGCKLLSPDPCTSQTATRWELLHNIPTGSLSSHQHLKRRNDSSDEELEEGLRRPVKQYISEDKVSAIFNRLEITNRDVFEANHKIECEELEDNPNSDSSDDNIESPMFFTDELQNAIKSKPMTDKVVQNELDRHSKAIVLWRPNNPLLPIAINGDNRKEVEEEVEECDQRLDSTKTNANDFNDSDIETIDFTPEEDLVEDDNEMELCP